MDGWLASSSLSYVAISSSLRITVGLVGVSLTYIQVGNADSDIVDHALFSGPPVDRLFHEEVDGALGVALLVEAVHNDHHYLVVAEAVPQAVRAHHQNLVVRAQVGEVSDLGLGRHADAGRRHVAD